MRKRSINLVHQFSIISAICILALIIVVGNIVFYFHSNYMIQTDINNSISTVKQVIKSEISDKKVNPSKLFSDEEILQHINDLILSLPNMVRLKIYNLQKEIVWSDEEQLIGKKSSDNHLLDQAFTGKVTSEFEAANDAENIHEGDLGIAKFIEIYVPVISEGGDVVAVIGVYKDPSLIMGLINRLRAVVWIVMTIGGVVLYLSLLVLVSRANKRQISAMSEAKRLSVVDEIARAVSSTLETEGVFGTVVRQLKRIFPFEFRMNIALYDSQNDTFTYSDTYDPSSKMQKITEADRPYPVNSLMLTKAFKERKTFYCPDVKKVSSELPLWKKLRETDTRTFIAIPLIIEEKCIGTLNMSSSITDAFTGEEIKLLETISSHVAIAINNAEIHEELKKANQQTAFMNSILDLFSKPLGLEQVMKDALDKALDFMDIDAGIIYLLDESGEGVYPLVSSGIPEENLERYELQTVNVKDSLNSLNGYVIGTGKSQYGSDISNNPHVNISITSERDWKSYAIVPIRRKDEILGTISMVSNRQNTINKEDVVLMEAMGAEMGVALENYALYENTNIQARHLSIVNEVSKAINSTLDIEQEYETIIEQLKQVIHSEFALDVVLYNATEQTITYAHGHDQSDALHGLKKVGRVHPFDSLLCSEAIKTKKPHYIPDIREAPLKNQMTKNFIDYGGRSVLYIPLIVGEECIGSMNLGAYYVDFFQKEEIELLETISSHVAIAINNAQIHTGLKKANREMAFMNNVMEILSNPYDISEVLQAALDNTIDFIGLADAYIYLLDETGEKLINIAHSDAPEEYLEQIKVLDVENSLNGYVVQRGESQCGSSFSDHPRVTIPAVKERNYKYFATVPVKSQEKIYGTITVTTTHDYTFSEQEIKLLEFLGAQIGVTLENSTLFEELKKSEEGLRKEIEERNRAEMNLIEANNLMEKTIFSLNEAVFIVARDTREIIRCNRAAEEIFGYSEGELLGRTTEILHVSSEMYKKFQSMLFPALDNNAVVQIEYQMRKNDGSIILTEQTVTKLIDDQGNQIGVVNVIRDITERKRAEETRIRLSTAIEQAAETIVITDIEGTILYVNPAFEEVSGYSKEEALGWNPRVLKSGKHDDAFYKEMWDTLTRGEVWKGHLINKKKDGSLYEEEAAISPIRDDSGEIVNYVAVKRDVTQEVLLEKQLRQAQKMEAIGTLAGGIAHDFNNILGIINGYAEMALMEEELSEESSIKHCLDNISKAGNRAKGLVNQILTFSRRGEQERHPVQIGLIVREALKMLRASLPATIEIRERISTSALALADPTQIHQVLMNLCTNAAYAMREKGGVLEVSLSKMELDSESAIQYGNIDPGLYIRLTVKDSGHGIDPEIMDRIFEPFFTSKSKEEGTGMGLAVVHGIVKDHGGTVTVHSEPGKGATFELLFPSVPHEITLDSQISEPALRGTEQILFVDDDETLCEMGQLILERLGYKVAAKTSSIEALEFFKGVPDEFDLVITDQTMPDMTGEKLAAEFLRIRQDIPIILCTGFSELVTPDTARAIGVRELVLKPIVWHKMAKTIRNVLEEE